MRVRKGIFALYQVNIPYAHSYSNLQFFLRFAEKDTYSEGVLFPLPRREWFFLHSFVPEAEQFADALRSVSGFCFRIQPCG